AGAALVFGDDQNRTNESDSPPAETLHVTLVATDDAANTLETENVTVDGERATVTAIHRTPGPRSFLRVALDGVRTEQGFRFAGNPVRISEEYTVTTETARVGTRVVERDVSPSFDTESRTVNVAATVRRPVAEAVTTGDEQTVGDTTVATVRSAETTAINETHSELQASVELETRFVDDSQHYGGSPVRLGRTLFLETNTYQFEAEIVGVNE
ncbi:MAG: hypothetical protein ACOCQM_09590, partial [Natronomonas sp.]